MLGFNLHSNSILSLSTNCTNFIMASLALKLSDSPRDITCFTFKYSLSQVQLAAKYVVTYLLCIKEIPTPQ